MTLSPIARHRAALREQTIAELRAYFAAHPPERGDRAILFGSLARGDFDGASDADILVIGEQYPDGPWGIGHRGVDLLHWTPAQWARAIETGNPFAEAIAREGIELWSRDTAPR